MELLKIDGISIAFNFNFIPSLFELERLAGNYMIQV